MNSSGHTPAVSIYFPKAFRSAVEGKQYKMQSKCISELRRTERYFPSTKLKTGKTNTMKDMSTIKRLSDHL